MLNKPIDRSKIICVDIETTGLDQLPEKDEIIQIGIVDGNCNTVFSEYIKPERHTEWPSATAKNNITPEMVANKQPLSVYRDQLINIFNNAELILTYNGKSFDIPFIQRELNYKFKSEQLDVMLEFMNNFALHRTQKFTLINVCKLFNIPNENAHDALNDVICTVKVFNRMQEELQKPNLDIIYTFPDGIEIMTTRLAKEYQKKTGQQITKTTYLENGQEIDKSALKPESAYRVGNFEKEKLLK